MIDGSVFQSKYREQANGLLQSQDVGVLFHDEDLFLPQVPLQIFFELPEEATCLPDVRSDNTEKHNSILVNHLTQNPKAFVLSR